MRLRALNVGCNIKHGAGAHERQAEIGFYGNRLVWRLNCLLFLMYRMCYKKSAM